MLSYHLYCLPHRWGRLNVQPSVRSPRWRRADYTRLAARSVWTVAMRYSPECVEYAFCELRLTRVLGSSLSSGVARSGLQVRHEAPEDGIRDAHFEAPQRLLAGFALRYLLAVVSPAANVRPGLAYRHHVQGVVELTVAGQREPVAHHLAA